VKDEKSEYGACLTSSKNGEEGEGDEIEKELNPREDEASSGPRRFIKIGSAD